MQVEDAMRELIERVSEKTGIDQGTAKTAIGHVLIFMRDYAPGSKVAELIDKTPLAHEAVESVASTWDGGVTAAIGGMTDLMGFGHAGFNNLGDKLKNLGLDQAQLETLLKEVFGRADELVGQEGVSEMTTALPYLAGLIGRGGAEQRARPGA